MHSSRVHPWLQPCLLLLLWNTCQLVANAAPVPVYYPSDGGHYSSNIGFSGNPIYPPLPQPLPFHEVRGSATFLSGGDSGNHLHGSGHRGGYYGYQGVHVAPYASRYAASSLPLPMVLPLPAERLYNTRGRPAIIPTPYSKYSSGSEKQTYNSMINQNSLSLPEPGFYGSGAVSIREVPTHADLQAAVGFYGKPLLLH